MTLGTADGGVKMLIENFNTRVLINLLSSFEYTFVSMLTLKHGGA